MATSFQSKFNINGKVDTSVNLLSNIETLAGAVGAWATFDIHRGVWSFILNEDTTPVYNFNDSNIIGGIQVSGTGLLELYNSVEVTFPHKDLGDQKDYRRVSIPDEDRYPNEKDNKLTINFDIVNDPVQAEIHALRELKQSRMDKIVQFQTDFNAIGLNAGDIITITSDYHEWESKQFRVITVTEEDDDSGNIVIGVTGLEWDPDIVNYSTVSRFERSRATGIVPKEANTDILGDEVESSLKLQLSDAAARHGLSLFYNPEDLSYTLDYSGEIVSVPGEGVLTSVDVLLFWTFTDGLDLDLRCSPIYNWIEPFGGGFPTLGYAGPPFFPLVGGLQQWPDPEYSSQPIVWWAGDNTGTGVESIRINIKQYLDAGGSKRYMVLECKANWYGVRGNNPVQLTGKVVANGTFSISNFAWTVDSADASRNIAGLENYVERNASSGFGEDPNVGDVVGYLIIDVLQGTAQIVNEIIPGRYNFEQPLFT